MKALFRTRLLGFYIVAIAICLAAIMACASTSGVGTSTAISDQPPGQRIFAATCATCHGTEGQGQPDWHIRGADGTLPAPPLNGDGHTWHHGDGLLYRAVSEGGQIWESPDIPQFKSGMPSFGEQLTHEEIVAVLEYVKSLWEDKMSRDLSIVEHQALMSETDPFPSNDS